jgi:hypothetical protein
VHDPLQAKALVLDDGTTAVVIVATDALAIGGIGDVSEDFLPRLRSRIEAELGVHAIPKLPSLSGPRGVIRWDFTPADAMVNGALRCGLTSAKITARSHGNRPLASQPYASESLGDSDA